MCKLLSVCLYHFTFLSLFFICGSYFAISVDLVLWVWSDRVEMWYIGGDEDAKLDLCTCIEPLLIERPLHV